MIGKSEVTHGPDGDEIEVTDDMVEAGVTVIRGFSEEHDSVYDLVPMIFRAMVLARTDPELRPFLNETTRRRLAAKRKKPYSIIISIPERGDGG